MVEPLNNNENLCAICLEWLENWNFIHFVCKHEFHFTSVNKMLYHNSNDSISCPNCRKKHNIYDEKIEKMFDVWKLLIGIDLDNKEVEINYGNEFYKRYQLSLCEYFKKFIKFFNNNNVIKDEIFRFLNEYFENFNGKIFDYNYFYLTNVDKTFNINDIINFKIDCEDLSLKMNIVERNNNINFENLKIKKHKKKLIFFYDNNEILKYNMIYPCNILKKILKDYIFITYNNMNDICL